MHAVVATPLLLKMTYAVEEVLALVVMRRVAWNSESKSMIFEVGVPGMEMLLVDTKTHVEVVSISARETSMVTKR
jgi:hypothetical protein